VYKKLPCFIHFILVHLWTYTRFVCIVEINLPMCFVLMQGSHLCISFYLLMDIREQETNIKVFCPKILFDTSILKDSLFRLLPVVILIFIPVIMGFSFQILVSDWYLLWYRFFKTWWLKSKCILCQWKLVFLFRLLR
jgi:hypothetical protein